MTTEAQNTIIVFMLGGFVAIGLYLLIVVPVLVVWRKLTSTTTKIDNVFKRWGA